LDIVFIMSSRDFLRCKGIGVVDLGR